MGLTEILPENVRKVLYAVYAFVGVALGAVLAGFAAAPGAEVPEYLVVGLAVYAFLGTALGLTAAANVGVGGTLDSVEMPQEIHTYYGKRPLPDTESVNVAGLNAFLAKQDSDPRAATRGPDVNPHAGYVEEDPRDEFNTQQGR